MTNETTQTNNALDQAKAQYQGICSMIDALNCDYDRLDELKEEKESIEYDVKCAEDEFKEVTENKGDATGLSDDVASTRQSLSDFMTDGRNDELVELLETASNNIDQEEAQTVIQEDPLSIEVRSGWVSLGESFMPEEFQILLCTGGPAVRILGELDEHNQPCRAWMEHQYWGTPWTRFYDVDQDVLLAYCAELYFGE